MSNRQELFQEELSLLNGKYLEFSKYFLDKLPEYFFTMPASTTGKYHPKYGLGEAGLLRHVKATIKIADSLFRMKEFDFSLRKRNLILTALLFHDGFKQRLEESGHTEDAHPVIVSKQILKDNESFKILGILDALTLAFLIWTHMGRWNKNHDNKVIMPIPFTKMQKFVHLCDYLASRKFLEVEFEESTKIPESVTSIG